MKNMQFTLLQILLVVIGLIVIGYILFKIYQFATFGRNFIQY